jgi:hypothetical protein
MFCFLTFLVEVRANFINVVERVQDIYMVKKPLLDSAKLKLPKFELCVNSVEEQHQPLFEKVLLPNVLVNFTLAR